MNWRAGFFRAWVVASGVWAASMLLLQVQNLFVVVQVDDLLGKPWRPWWASFATYVQPYADASLWTRPGRFPPGTDLSPSNALIAARAADVVMDMVLPPLLLLVACFAVRWIATGFGQA
jgi:hypothetical protein